MRRTPDQARFAYGPFLRERVQILRRPLQALRAQQPEALTDELFGRLPQHFRSEQAGGLEAVIECRVDFADDDCGRYQIRIERGRCSVRRNGAAEPDVVLSIRYDDLVSILTQAATASQLFLRQRLVVSGDVLLATRLPSLFRMPSVELGPLPEARLPAQE